MVKKLITNRTAAGLRRSAIAERQRLREEWSSLKGTDDEVVHPAEGEKKQTRILYKNLYNIKGNRLPSHNMANLPSCSSRNEENSQTRSSNDALRGIVALVDVGAGSRAVALRAALSALGATVVSAFTPLVTHLVWSQGSSGCRNTRAQARALACKVVSPLWVEACAASARRISEKVFPTTSRASDVPSPATLCRLLKIAEKENWPVPVLVSDSEDDGKQVRLRISSDTDGSANKTTDDDTTDASVDIENRVNTAPRRALPVSMSPPPANPKSRRKLFTARADGEEDSDAEKRPATVTKTNTRPERAPTRPVAAPNRTEKATAPVERVLERQKKTKKYNLTQEQKKNLENAERMARRLAAEPATNKRVEVPWTQRRRTSNVPKIVLSGMPSSQYRAVFTAVQTLNGKVQKYVNRRTTHVLLGSCKADQRSNKEGANNTTKEVRTDKPFSLCNECNSPEGLVMRMLECDNVEITNHCSNPTRARGHNATIICSTVNRTCDGDVICDDDVIGDVPSTHDVSNVCNGIVNDKRLRTRKTLVGAARGCRVLHAQWALDSLKENKWLPHIGYEVTYLLKIAQKARVERSAIGKMHKEYGYNVFHGMRVSVSGSAEQRDAAVELLSLCGAKIINYVSLQTNIISTQNIVKSTQKACPTQNSAWTQNGGFTQNGAYCDTVVIGNEDEEVSSKWVFDSVAAGRPRTTRRYINKNICI